MVRLERLRRAQAGAALRRPAPARRAGAGDRQPPAGAAARRAARRARPQAAPGDAGRAQAHPGRGRHHLRLRHPRPGGGADDERPPGRVPRGAHRAGGHARRGLRASGQRVRRRLRGGLQRRRARRAAVHDPAGEGPAAGRGRGRRWPARRGRHRRGRGLRGDGHALSRRARRRRSAAGRAPEPRDVVGRTPTSCAGGGCGSAWREDQTFAIEEVQSREEEEGP